MMKLKRFNLQSIKVALLIILSFLIGTKSHIVDQNVEPEAVFAQGSLQGLGIFTNGGGQASNYINTVNPKMVLLLNDFGYASSIPSSTLVVGRSTDFSDTLPSSPNVRPRLDNFMSSYPAVDVWQAYNEPLYHLIHQQGYTTSTAFSWLTTHDLDVIQAGIDNGKSVCIGNFKEGWPTNLSDPSFQSYISAIMNKASAATNITVYLCVHEHENSTSNGGTWTFGNRYNGRFTQIVGSGLNLPVLVTVAGYDSEAGPTVGAGSGWLGTISSQEYTDMLLSYQSAALNAGAQGVAVFQVGLGGQWDSFDISSLIGSVASGQSVSCVGDNLAEYLNTVITTANSGNGLQNIRLLSPGFNMTNLNGAAIAKAMDVALGGDWSGIYGIAGNAYNCCGNSITGHINSFLSAIGDTGLSGKQVLITETGDLGAKDTTAIGNEFRTIQNSGTYIGALLFNPLGSNCDPNFNKHELDDNQINEIKSICGGGCSKMGANSAVYYGNENSCVDEPDFYGHADSLGMQFTLSISNADPNDIAVIQNALNRGLTPVIRVGDSFNPGPLASDYGTYLAQIDDQIGGTVYAIAGPNEPQTECWAAPACGCDVTSGPGASPIGQGRHPIDEGFSLAKYACVAPSNDPEFHPLRPYPASSCDLLIPRSYPEAPLSLDTSANLADYLKYNTFACGTNMTFSHLERFDPYGFWNIQSRNNVLGTVTNFNDVEYLHTYCPPVPSPASQTTGTFTQTCFRTIGYDVYTDFSQSNIGILGNTQNDDFTDKQKVNNYLGWYFAGTPQASERVLLDPTDTQSTSETGSVVRWSDIDRLVNFSGPLRKLLPKEAMEAVRNVLIEAANDETGDIHDYMLDTQGVIRLSNIAPGLEEFFPHIPNATLEDIAGEAYPTSRGAGIGAQTDPTGGLSTAPSQFTITCAVGAHENCP